MQVTKFDDVFTPGGRSRPALFIGVRITKLDYPPFNMTHGLLAFGKEDPKRRQVPACRILSVTGLKIFEVKEFRTSVYSIRGICIIYVLRSIDTRFLS